MTSHLDYYDALKTDLESTGLSICELNPGSFSNLHTCYCNVFVSHGQERTFANTAISTAAFCAQCSRRLETPISRNII